MFKNTSVKEKSVSTWKRDSHLREIVGYQVWYKKEEDTQPVNFTNWCIFFLNSWNDVFFIYF